MNPNLQALKEVVDHHCELGGMTRAGVEKIVAAMLKLGATQQNIVQATAQQSDVTSFRKKAHGAQLHVLVEWHADAAEREYVKFAVKEWLDS